MPIRRVAAYLDIDPSTLSKIERGERNASRDYVRDLAELFDVEEGYLISVYLSDKVAYDLLDENDPVEILKISEAKIKYLKAKKAKQSKLDLE